MARDERMKHMQLYPGWSARDNYGVKKKRGDKGKKREKNPGENAGNLFTNEFRFRIYLF
jgi:transcription factor 7-like 2